MRLVCLGLLLAGVSMPLQAQSRQPAAPMEAAAVETPPSAGAEIADGWGILGEMVGREFEWRKFLVVVRWAEPGKVLTLDSWSGDFTGTSRYGYEFRRDPVTGQTSYNQTDLSEKHACLVDFDAESSLSLQCRKAKPVRWISRDEAGGIIWHTDVLRPLDPAGKRGQLFARLVAEGRIDGPGAAPGTPALAAAPAAPTGQKGSLSSPATASIAVPGSPMTDAQLAGLDSFVGGTFLQTDGKSESLVETRWIEPGRSYASVVSSTFAPQRANIYQVAENGAISAPTSADRKGFVDQSGLPVIEVRLAEKQLQRIRLAPTPQGFRVIVEESKTPADKPAKWKALASSERIRIDATKATELVARMQSQREARWEPVSYLLEKPQVCVQYEPGFVLTRQMRIHPQFGRATNRTYPVMRLSSARWVTPWQEMEITSTLGEGRQMIDRLTLLTDGTFEMKSSGVDGAAVLRGLFSRSDWPSGNGHYSSLRFPLPSFKAIGMTYEPALIFQAHFNDKTLIKKVTSFEGSYSSTLGCDFESYNPGDSAKYARDFADASRGVRASMQDDQEYWADAAQGYAEGQAMLAGIRGDLFRTVAGIPAAIASVQQQKAQLETLRLAAEQETALKRAAEEEKTLAATPPAGSANNLANGGGITVANTAPARTGAPSAPSQTPTRSAPATPTLATTPLTPAPPQMCTTPGGSREWSTGGLTSLADAQANYEKEAAFQRSKGSSMSPMRPSGKTVTNLGVTYANYVATITWPAKTGPCGSRVSGQ